MTELIGMTYLDEILMVGTVGIVAGAMFPWLFRLVAYVVEVVRNIVE